MRKFWLFAAALLLTAASSMAAQKSQFMYASTDGGAIYQYQITDSGTLRPLTPPKIQAAEEAIQLVLHPSGRFVYAVRIHQLNSGHALAQVTGYRVNPNGTLTALAGEPRTLAAPADNAVMDPRGRFLFVSGEDDRLFTFRIQHDGALTPLADNKNIPTFHIDTQGDGGGEVTGSYNYDVLSFDHTGRFLYLCSVRYGFDSRHSDFLTYRLDTRGILHPLGHGVHEMGEANPCFTTPRGGLFVARQSGDNDGTYEYHIGPHGRLTPASPHILPGKIAILTTEGAAGETLWTSSPIAKDSQKYSLASYRIGLDGRLNHKATHRGVLPWTTSIRAGVSGHFLYATGYQQGDYTHKPQSSLLGFAFTAQGTLKPVAAPPQLEGRCLSLVVISSPASAVK